MRLGITIIFMLLSFNVYALEKSTHEVLNEKIGNISGLNSYLINQLGFQSGVRTSFNNKWAIDWLKLGGQAEDEPMYTRSLNHFHDPLKPWDSAGFKGTFKSSLIWAQDQGAFGSQFGGDMSWKKAREGFYNGLTATDKDTRDVWLAGAFKAVGQVMHLVSDMAVPAHVRNDLPASNILEVLI